MDHTPDIEEALKHFLGRDPIFIGYLNPDVVRTKNPRNQQVDEFLDSFGLLYLLSHFKKWLQF